MPSDSDQTYREILLAPLRKCADYTPKFGTGAGETGVDLDAFVELYGADPLYHWMGFDSPLMYAAHKAAGGMTSLYRQLGIGCERLFRQILRDSFGLDEDQATWKYAIVGSSGQVRYQSLDGRVRLDEVDEDAARDRVAAWLAAMTEALGIQTEVDGAVFEVRQGYKSKDSKRQQADLANAAKAISERYLPVLTVVSSQLDSDIRTRYHVGKWGVLAGTLDADDQFQNTFAFCRDVVGYDLRAFFERNHEVLRAEVTGILVSLLEPS